MTASSTVRPTVLLLGGVSGAGKSTAAAALGRRLGLPWFQVDDLRLALQRSRSLLPEGTDALHYFADIVEKPWLWRQPPETLRDALIATGAALAPALEAVVVNHLDGNQPIVIEGDGVLPALLARPALQPAAAAGALRAVFVVATSEAALRDAILARGRGAGYMTTDDIHVEARAKWLFSAWLEQEARRLELPVLPSRPVESLAERIGVAAGWR